MIRKVSDWFKSISPETLKIRVTIAAVGGLFVWIVLTLVDLQITNHEKYLFEAKRQQFGTVPVKPERGLIYDRDGNLLVYNSADYTVNFNFRGLTKKTIQDIIRKVSKVTGKDTAYYYAKMKPGRYEAVLEKKITGSTVLALKNLDISALKVSYEPTRIYHYGNLASHVLGYVDRKTLKGRDGIEYSFEKTLAGVEGVQSVRKNRSGSIASLIEEMTIPPVQGKSVVLTIDQGIQKPIEDILADEKTKSLKATVIIMDPRTGEVLAFANSGGYDPNHYSSSETRVRKNSGVTDIYEPGSTFKGITFASLIDRGKLTSFTEIIDTDNGVYSPFKGVVIRDVHPYPMLSVSDVLAKSSNVGTMKLVQRITDEEFYDDLRKLGFGSKTNIQLPAETKGRLASPASWSKLSKSSLSYGYEIGVSPIQLITAYAAIINGGVLFEPRLVKSVLNPDGSIYEEYPAKEIRKVYTARTSELMRGLLVRAVDNGTGKKAAIEGISIGGKTGTSRSIIDGKYTKERYNSSFVGFFPAENPEYIVLVVAESAGKGLYTGGELAAPLFREIALKIIEKRPELLRGNSAPEPKQDETVQFSFAKNEITPSEYIPMKEAGKITVRKTIMPDLTGLSIREALDICGEMKLRFKVNGHGRIISQSVAPESRVKPGDMVVLGGSHHFTEEN
ncbi:MAG: putative peptidoglycan D,D-transpeptidase PenA [Ignavibacteriaceae bacterium]|nr:putative peptidoglycan D,D-transpeptidase PenA [Ignavibacteriaceae bacterium]